MHESKFLAQIKLYANLIFLAQLSLLIYVDSDEVH